MTARGVQTLYDDRDETAGVKFNDADLIGIPLRLVISERLLAVGAVEMKLRNGAIETIPRSEVVERIWSTLQQLVNNTSG